MKKTLIALMAMAGVAVGADVVQQNDETVTYTITTGMFTGSNQGSYSSFKLTLSDGLFQGTASTTNAVATATDSIQSFLTSTVNLTSIGVVFNITDASYTALTLVLTDAQTHAVVGVSSGYTQTANVPQYDVFDSSKYWTRNAGTFTFGDDTTLTIGTQYVATFYSTYTETEKTVHSTKLMCSTNASNTNGFWLQDGYQPAGVVITATGLVPEPTTATLSLLALAGLAARRRRK